MRGSFAQLKSWKTFSGAVVDETMKQIFPFTRIGYVYNFTSDAMRCDCSNCHARRAEYWRPEHWTVWEVCSSQ